MFIVMIKLNVNSSKECLIVEYLSTIKGNPRFEGIYKQILEGWLVSNVFEYIIRCGKSILTL